MPIIMILCTLMLIAALAGIYIGFALGAQSVVNRQNRAAKQIKQQSTNDITNTVNEPNNKNENKRKARKPFKEYLSFKKDNSVKFEPQCQSLFMSDDIRPRETFLDTSSILTGEDVSKSIRSKQKKSTTQFGAYGKRLDTTINS